LRRSVRSTCRSSSLRTASRGRSTPTNFGVNWQWPWGARTPVPLQRVRLRADVVRFRHKRLPRSNFRPLAFASCVWLGLLVLSFPMTAPYSYAQNCDAVQDARKSYQEENSGRERRAEHPPGEFAQQDDGAERCEEPVRQECADEKPPARLERQRSQRCSEWEEQDKNFKTCKAPAHLVGGIECQRSKASTKRSPSPFRYRANCCILPPRR